MEMLLKYFILIDIPFLRLSYETGYYSFEDERLT